MKHKIIYIMALMMLMMTVLVSAQVIDLGTGGEGATYTSAINYGTPVAYPFDTNGITNEILLDNLSIDIYEASGSDNYVYVAILGDSGMGTPSSEVIGYATNNYSSPNPDFIIGLNYYYFEDLTLQPDTNYWIAFLVSDYSPVYYRIKETLDTPIDVINSVPCAPEDCTWDGGSWGTGTIAIQLFYTDVPSGPTCSVCSETCSPCGGGCTSTDLYQMFLAYDFDADPDGIGDITGWDTSCVTSMESMFHSSNFNQDISNWDTSNVESFAEMFTFDEEFNQPIGSWNTSSLNRMLGMFEGATSFNQPLNNWGVSGVDDLSGVFSGATSFNQPLNNWDTSNVVTTTGMFRDATSFNQPLNNWDTSNFVIVTEMFATNNLSPTFNQPLSNWDTGNVVDMSYMFESSVFNQDINAWDTGNVEYLTGTFDNNKRFNKPIKDWDTSKVITMQDTFNGATAFNQDVSDWNISQVQTMERMFKGVTLDSRHYDKMLTKWEKIGKNNVTLDAGKSKHTRSGKGGKTNLRTNKHWTITDGGEITEGAKTQFITNDEGVVIGYVNHGVVTMYSDAEKEGLMASSPALSIGGAERFDIKTWWIDFWGNMKSFFQKSEGELN